MLDVLSSEPALRDDAFAENLDYRFDRPEFCLRFKFRSGCTRRAMVSPLPLLVRAQANCFLDQPTIKGWNRTETTLQIRPFDIETPTDLVEP